MKQLKNFKSQDAPGYDKMDGNELMTALKKSVKAAKASGDFSPEQIDDFVRFVSPNLDEASRARLVELAVAIKGD